MELERRFSSGEVRISPTLGSQEVSSLKIEGYACRFDSRTDMGDFLEEADPDMFDGELDGDVRALFNHNPNFLLGRTKAGSLKLSVDAKGLRYSVQLPDVSYAKDLWQSIKRGDCDQSSYSFRVKKDGEKWSEAINARGETVPLRILRSVSLFDVSPCTYGANPETSADARAEARSRSLVIARRSAIVKPAPVAGVRLSSGEIYTPKVENPFRALVEAFKKF